MSLFNNPHRTYDDFPGTALPQGLRLAIVQPLNRRRGSAPWRAAVQVECSQCGEPIGPGTLGNAVFLADDLRYGGAAAVRFVHKQCDRHWRRAHRDEGRWGWLPLEVFLSDLGLRLVQAGGK
jgi:hypothetical protein